MHMRNAKGKGVKKQYISDVEWNSLRRMWIRVIIKMTLLYWIQDGTCTWLKANQLVLGLDSFSFLKGREIRGFKAIKNRLFKLEKIFINQICNSSLQI